MEFTFHTVTGKQYFLKGFDGSRTIAQMKVELGTQYPELIANNLCLLYNSGILEDSLIVSTISIRPGTFIVLHQCKQPIKQPLEINKGTESPQPPTPKVVASPKSPDTTKKDDAPPNLQERIDNLVEMGFSLDLAEKALIASGYNVTAAADMIISHRIPGKEPVEPTNEQHIHNGYGTVAQMMDSLTPEQQAVIARIEEMGFDRSTTIQVYLACEKNEEKTISCLKEMKN